MLLVCGFVAAAAARMTVAPGRATSRASTAPVPATVPARSSSVGSPADGSGDFQPNAPARHWTSIVLHHSATAAGDVASIDAVHRRQKDAQGKFWLGIGYHFVVGNGHPMGDGEIQPTFRWLEQLPGAHAGRRDHNEQGIGICLIGNFDESRPTPKQLAAVRRLVKTLAARHAIGRERILRHLDLQATACPGRWFPWDQVLVDVPVALKGS